jgi:hypothetical protein
MRRYLADEPARDEPDDGDFDDGWMGGVPHGGVWSRADKRDGLLRCREHD